MVSYWSKDFLDSISVAVYRTGIYFNTSEMKHITDYFMFLVFFSLSNIKVDTDKQHDSVP